VVIAAVTRRPAYTMELLSYVLVFGAIFIGFIYRADSAFITVVLRFISIGMVAVACVFKKFFFYI
jgi:hypothetical protein